MVKFNSKKISITAVALIAIALSFSLFAKMLHPHIPRLANLAPINVYVAKAATKVEPELITSVGHVKSLRSVDLSFDVSGHVVDVLAKSGQRVKKGQVIAKLDDRSDLATLKSLQASLDLAKSTYQKMLKLKQYGDISEQVIAQKNAALVEAEANLQQQQVIIAQKQLKAPFSGVLGVFQYNVGAFLAQGTGLVKLVQQAPLKAVYAVPATLRSKLVIGQTLQVTTSAYPKKSFAGVLNFISPNVSATTGTLTLEAKVKNSDFLLSPGMFINIVQTINPNRKLLMIPDVAVMTDIGGQYVFVLQNNSTVNKVYIKVGEVFGSLIAVTSAIKAGETIVTAGQQKLEDGSKVKVLKSQLTTK